jgi:molecular chaperone GrpE (heat shock protein)
VTNKINTVTQNNVFASMMLQLHSQSAQQAQMQKELQNIKYKLEQTSKTLAQKDLLIDSLELDLEHMIDQLVRIQHTSPQANSKKQWITRPVPGLQQEISA